MGYDFNKVNKGQKIFEFQLPKEAPYRKLQEQEPGAKFVVAGFFISKSKNDKYKDHPVAVIPDTLLETLGFYMDLPSHLTDTVKNLMEDEDAVKEINLGHCAIVVTEYDNDMGHFKGVEFTNA